MTGQCFCRRPCVVDGRAVPPDNVAARSGNHWGVVHMGRPEGPLDRDGSPIRELAYWLRDLRRQTGLTYQQLAQRTHYSTSTLQEAMSGRRLPTLPVLRAIVRA